MILRIVRLTILPDRTSDFLNHFNRIKHRILSFEGCSSLELHSALHHPNVFFTVSCWQSEFHLQNYQQSDFFKETWSIVKPLFEKKAEAWSLEKIA
jgi:quinol monooxygenase YgiN